MLTIRRRGAGGQKTDVGDKTVTDTYGYASWT